jgi:hypothetical protein
MIALEIRPNGLIQPKKPANKPPQADPNRPNLRNHGLIATSSAAC